MEWPGSHQTGSTSCAFDIVNTCQPWPDVKCVGGLVGRRLVRPLDVFCSGLDIFEGMDRTGVIGKTQFQGEGVLDDTLF